MKILIIAPSWIGDTVAAQPLFRRLMERHPGALIDALAPAWVAPVLEAMPEIRRVVPSPFRHGGFKLRGRWTLGRSLAQENYDEAVVLPNSWKSALVPFFAGIPRRTGFVGEARYGLLNRLHRLDKQALPRQVDRYAQLAEAPGTPLPQPLPLPRLVRTPRQVAATLARLSLAASPRPVVFCPGAEYGPAKRWPEAHFAALARALAARGTPVWLLGSAKDAGVGDDIVRLSGGACRNLCGVTGLAQALDLIAAAALVVTNDSGLMHVAAALEVRLIALFGSSSPEYTPPLSNQAQVLWLKLDCSPCFKRQCPLGHFRCMRELTPEQVLGLALQQLEAAQAMP